MKREEESIEYTKSIKEINTIEAANTAEAANTKKATKSESATTPFKGRTIRKSLIIAAALLLVALLTALRVLWPVMPDKPEISPGSARWMGGLDGRMPICDINLPGTHDSGTQFVDLPYFCQCQTSDIKTQLEMGYRFLDIRLMEDGAGGLNLCHGGFLCRTGPFPWSEALGLSQILDWCYSFLEENPSEAIVFLAKNESGSKSDREIRDLLFSYIEKKPDRWYLENRVPALDQVRGKLILANRMKDGEGTVAGGLAFLWEDQGNREPFGEPADMVRLSGDTRLHVQDRYCYDREDKWAAFVRTLEESRGMIGEDSHIYLNYLSTKGSRPVGHPLSYAKELNKRLAAYDPASHESPARSKYGWIILDFGSPELAEKIYKTNF